MIRRIGKEIDSADYWRERAEAYAGETADAYHSHRLAMVESLLPAEGIKGLRCLEFGSGDGILLARLAANGGQVIGLERSADLLRQSEERLAGTRATLRQGGIEALGEVAAASIDVLLCINVMAYFTDAEEQDFYRQLGRVLTSTGQFIVTHSNELFDLFALNALTADFIVRHFCGEGARTRISSLLSGSDSGGPTTTYNIRENPLSYRHKLAKYGLKEVQQEFANLHDLPPSLMKSESSSKRYVSTDDWAETERWKLMFQCSMFGSRSIRMP